MVYTAPSGTLAVTHEKEVRFSVSGLSGLRADCQRGVCDSTTRFLCRHAPYVNAARPRVLIIPGMGVGSDDEFVVTCDPGIDAFVIDTWVTRLLRSRGLTARRSNVN